VSNNKSEALVYLVDDEFAVRDSLTLLIESTGQAVRGFAAAEDFLNNYDPEQPGCLLLDVRLPSMNGLDLQSELLSREISIPIIFISGHAGVSDSAKAFRAGAVDFLEKPFDNTTLMERIAEALKKDKFVIEKIEKALPQMSVFPVQTDFPKKQLIVDIENKTITKEDVANILRKFGLKIEKSHR